MLRKCISLLNRTETVMDLWWEKQVIYSVAVDQDHFRQKLAIQFAVIMGRWRGPDVKPSLCALKNVVQMAEGEIVRLRSKVLTSAKRCSCHLMSLSGPEAKTGWSGQELVLEVNSCTVREAFQAHSTSIRPTQHVDGERHVLGGSGWAWTILGVARCGAKKHCRPS